MVEQAIETILIKDSTTASFGTDVITGSAQQVVLVDFWAPWCGPCKQLTPLLENAVRLAGGKVKLVKVNIDEHPQISGQLGVKSIPAVFAFQKGQPVDGFTGTLPESQIFAFLERLVGPIGGQIAAMQKIASQALGAGETHRAADLFAQILEEDSSYIPAIGGYATALVTLGDLPGAKAILATVPSDSQSDSSISTARAMLENAELAENIGYLAELERAVAADPKNCQARFDFGVALNAHGNREGAADALLEIIRRDRNWNDDAARKQILQFFDAWGFSDPDTLIARRKLSGVLFS